MKEPAKGAGIIGVVPGMVGPKAPSKTGLVYLVGETARRLARREPRASVVDSDARAEEGRACDPGASRSALDAGLTGGMTFLFDGSGNRRGR